MKKLLSLTLATLAISLILSGCGNRISQDDYDTALNKVDELQQQLDEQKNEYDQLMIEYDNYKQKMSPYEDLSAAQVEAARLEAEQKAQQIKDEKARQAAEAEEAARIEAEQKAAEEALGYETGITYDNIARTPDDYLGKKIKFTGKVVQLIEGTFLNNIRLAIDSDYDQILYCTYDPSILSSRILEDDIITVYGTSDGIYTYTSTLGGKISVPSASIDSIEVAE